MAGSPIAAAAAVLQPTAMAPPAATGLVAPAPATVLVAPAPPNPLVPAAPVEVVKMAPANPIKPAVPVPVVPAPVAPVIVPAPSSGLATGIVPAAPGLINTIVVPAGPSPAQPVLPAPVNTKIDMVIPAMTVSGPNTNSVVITNDNNGGTAVTSPVGGTGGIVGNAGSGVGALTPAVVSPSQNIVIGSGSGQSGVSSSGGGNKTVATNVTSVGKDKSLDPCADFAKYCQIKHDLVYSVLGPEVLAKCGHVCLRGGAKG